MSKLDNFVYEIEHLTKRYDNQVLANDDISLKIRRGEILGLFGPNGSGKTTLVKQLIGLLLPTDGNITLCGLNIEKQRSQIPRLVAYQGQVGAAFGAFRFSELIAHTGIYRGLSLQEAKKETDALVDYFGCAEIAQRFRYQLSGGERKLSFVLSAFISQRPIVILDEPTNDMDPSHRSKLWSYIRKLCKEQGITFLLVTHNIDEAEDLVDRVAVIKQGRLIAHGSVGALKAAVHDDISVDLFLKEGMTVQIPVSAQNVQANHWKFVLPKESAFSQLDELFKIEGHKIDDFKVSKATLSEAYAFITEKRIEKYEKANSHP